MTDTTQDTPQVPPKPKKHHLIKSAWLRRPLKVLLGIFIFILLLPVLIYIPPVQTLLKDVACSMLSKSTGMQVSIETFRLRYPLDVQLDGVRIIEASGDTMVTARSLTADLKVRPLFKLNAEINKLVLEGASYNMVSADSSMTLRLKAGYLRTDAGSDFNLKQMHLSLKNPELRDATVRVDMDVWKQQKDTTQTPTQFVIDADSLTISNVTFAMSMLPTIADLNVNLGKGKVKDAHINLTDSKIEIASVEASGCTGTYLSPTPEYVKAHPAPVDTTASASAPMTISIGKASLNFTHLLYATQGAKPLPGFDPSYIEVTDLNIAADDFYNQAALLRLPITSLTATERSGLQITSASGLLDINADGLRLTDFALTTPASSLKASANLPFELMAMAPNAPAGTVNASGTLAWSDIFAFMPDLRSMVSKYLPAGAMSPLRFTLEGGGSLQRIVIDRFNLLMGRFLSLDAKGYVANPTNLKNLDAKLTLDGSMKDPSLTAQLLQKLAAIGSGYHIPAFTIKGTASAHGDNYAADLNLLTSAGNIGAKGSLQMNSQRYDIDATFSHLNVGAAMPSLGVGMVDGHLHAAGAGFDPSRPATHTQVNADFSELTYNGQAYAPLHLTGSLTNGDYDVKLEARAPQFNLDFDGTGHIAGQTYYADASANINYIDLQALGFMDEVCRGSGRFTLRGNANPNAMLFDLDLSLDDVDWEYGKDFYSLRHAFDATFLADTGSTLLHISGDELDLDFTSAAPLTTIMGDVMTAMPTLEQQLSAMHFDFEALQPLLPPFKLVVDARGSGLLHELLDGSGYSFSTLQANFSNTDKIAGNARLLGTSTGTMVLDTITLNLNQQGKAIDYRLHMGNRPGNLPEFANVNATGSVGGDGASIYLRQQNAAGEIGYKLGLTAQMVDSVLSLHLTPDDTRIAYKSWEINPDNYIKLGPGKRIGADLEASSGTSSIALHTTEGSDSLPGLDVDIRNLLIQDFLQMSLTAPPITGAINSKMHLVYRGTAVTGNGNIGVQNLTYNKTRVGDLDFTFKAGMGFKGNVGASLALQLNKKEVLKANGFFLASDSTASTTAGLKQRAMLNVKLQEFPLSIANPFLGADVAKLSGFLNGSMALTGTMTEPLLNGEITCDSVAAYIPMTGTTYRFDTEHSISVKDNNLNFDNFSIYAANNNPLTINGFIDARKISNILFDITLAGSNVALVNNSKKTGSQIYGQLFIDLNAHAAGSMSRMNIDGNLSILPATNIFYTLSPLAAGNLNQAQSTTDLVKFVQFSDTLQMADADSITDPTTAMRITASLNIISGAQATVNLSDNGTDKVQLSPSGNLSFVQTYMGDRRLNGTLQLGEGMARYSIQFIGEKTFNIEPSSTVTWTGDIMNPRLSISATDHVKANVQQEGANSRLIYFDVGLNVGGTLSAPQVTFDLSTDDDITVQNELQGMTADQRQASAINLLLYNTYTGPGVKASANLGGNPLYSLLEGQLNSLAAKYITGVDLSFGIDQYDKTVDGQTSGTTSYSYQVSKSLFDNRFKIIVGGNYSTDANADENFAQNLISDISFEYSLRQTATSSMYLRLFRHTGYESILEGEVTETGVGFAMKRKLANLRNLFRFGRRKKAITTDSLPTDTPDSGAHHWQKVNLDTVTTR